MRPDEQQEIFGQWLDEHRGLLFKIARAYAFTKEDQEDLFQEVAAQVWNSVPRFQQNSKVSTWIYRVSLYTAMAWSKKQRRHRETQENMTTVPNLLSERPDTHPQLEWLYEQIAQLDKIDRSLTLMMLDGFSYREIAETLGITENYVGVKLNRIKKRLISQANEQTNEI